MLMHKEKCTTLALLSQQVNTILRILHPLLMFPFEALWRVVCSEQSTASWSQVMRRSVAWRWLVICRSWCGGLSCGWLVHPHEAEWCEVLKWVFGLVVGVMVGNAVNLSVVKCNVVMWRSTVVHCSLVQNLYDYVLFVRLDMSTTFGCSSLPKTDFHTNFL